MQLSTAFFIKWLRHHRRWMHLLIVTVWALIFLIPYFVGSRLEILRRPYLAVDHYYADELARQGRHTPPNPDLVFLGINDASISLDQLDPATVQASPVLSAMQQWPWSGQVYASLLDRLTESGAKVVVFDILFGPKKDDAILKASLDRHADRVVVACNFSDARDQRLTLPSVTLIPPVLPVDSRTAFVNFWPDFDDVIRRTSFHKPYVGADIGRAESPYQIDSLAAKVARVANANSSIPADDRTHLFRYTGPHGSFDTLPVYEVFDPKSWELNFKSGAFFKDKIVMVGPQGNFHQDEHGTPLGSMDGAEVHLQALNALLHGEFLTYTGDSFSVTAALVGLTALIAWLVGVTSHRGAWYGFGAVIFGAFYLLLGIPLFSHGIVLAVAAPLGAFFSSTLTGLTVQYVLEQLELSRTRRFFERYVSPKVVQEILDNPAEYYESLVGRRREVTVLFSDLRGFTSMTEQADSEQLVQELNEYLQQMTKALFDHEGILDKFIGDAVMAVWGSFAPHPVEDSKRAVDAALAMSDALVTLNVSRRARGKPDLAMGIGIHHGEAVVGDIGSDQQRNFTVIGDTVNLASRLEGATKEYAIELIVSETVENLVRPFFHLQTVDFVRVKGRKKAVGVYTVLGTKAKVLEPDRMTSLATYEDAMKAYLAQDFVVARKGFEACLHLFPEDKLAGVFIERCAEFEQVPPPAEWDGSYTMTSK